MDDVIFNFLRHDAGILVSDPAFGENSTRQYYTLEKIGEGSNNVGIHERKWEEGSEETGFKQNQFYLSSAIDLEASNLQPEISSMTYLATGYSMIKIPRTVYANFAGNLYEIIPNYDSEPVQKFVSNLRRFDKKKARIASVKYTSSSEDSDSEYESAIESEASESISDYDTHSDRLDRNKSLVATESNEDSPSDEDPESESESDQDEEPSGTQQEYWEVERLSIAFKGGHSSQLLDRTKIAATLCFETGLPSLFFQDTEGYICVATPEMPHDSPSGDITWIANRISENLDFVKDSSRIPTRAKLGSPISACSADIDNIKLEILVYVNEADGRIHLYQHNDRTGEWRDFIITHSDEIEQQIRASNGSFVTRIISFLDGTTLNVFHSMANGQCYSSQHEMRTVSEVPEAERTGLIATNEYLKFDKHKKVQKTTTKESRFLERYRPGKKELPSGRCW